MKKTVLSLFLLVSVMQVLAQSGGPDNFGYTWRDDTHAQGPAYSWIDITSLPGVTQVTGLADDNTSQMYPIGFQFPYYWYTVSEFIVGSNGYIIFNNGALSAGFPEIPSAALPNDFIAPFMSDLNFDGTGNTAECWYWSNNVDSLIVSYINVPFWVNNVATPYTGSNTFQLILSAVDSSITFQYQTLQGTSSALADYMSIGIENISGAIGLQHSYEVYPADTHAIKFYYPDTTSFVVNDAATFYNNNPDNGALFLSKDGNAFMMDARIGNVGNQNIDTVPVFMRILNSSNIIEVQHNDTAFNVAPQQTADFSSPNLFSPALEGKYAFRTSVSLPGDFTAANDQKAVKLIVVDTTQTLIPLSYTGQIAVPTADGISWSGGNAGVGVEIVPPFYPFYIHKMEFFISSNPQPSAFAGLIYDNNGPNNGPGNLLDSAYMQANDVVTLGWNSFTLTNPILVDSGSLFVEWRMDGDGIQIGTDSTGPVSNRSFEVLGSWSILRYRETRDPMIRLQISSMAVTDVEKTVKNDFAGNFFPSPANDKIEIEFTSDVEAKNIQFDFYDSRGQLISSEIIASGRTRYSFDVSEYATGIYLCKITAGDREINRKVVITR